MFEIGHFDFSFKFWFFFFQECNSIYRVWRFVSRTGELYRDSIRHPTGLIRSQVSTRISRIKSNIRYLVVTRAAHVQRIFLSSRSWSWRYRRSWCDASCFGYCRYWFWKCWSSFMTPFFSGGDLLYNIAARGYFFSTWLERQEFP